MTLSKPAHNIDLPWANADYKHNKHEAWSFEPNQTKSLIDEVFLPHHREEKQAVEERQGGVKSGYRLNNGHSTVSTIDNWVSS